MSNLTNAQLAAIVTQAVLAALTATTQATHNAGKSPVNAQINRQPPVKKAHKAKPKAGRRVIVAEPKRTQSGLNRKEERKLALQLAVVKAFADAGFGNVTPRVDVKTAAMWHDDGLVPAPGQNPLWVKTAWMSDAQLGYPLFHKSQLVAK